MKPFSLEDRIQYYGDPRLERRAQHTGEPVNAMMLTSIRDVGSCDKNGEIVDTPEGDRYMEGTIERLIEETRDEGKLHGIFRLVGVITDDMERDMRQSSYSAYPTPEKKWVHSLHLRDAHGQVVAGKDMTHWIPSKFRSLPLVDTENRLRTKEEFERQVLEIMRQKNADVLISDHYMARIAFMIRSEYGKFGKVLNIHPAVTQMDNPYCFRGPTPTQDAIDRAKADGHASTGATLHFINEVIDDGPQISYVAGTPVYPFDKPQHLRYRNYQAAKLPLLVAGLRHYICNIYPHLDIIDVNTLTLLNRVSDERA